MSSWVFVFWLCTSISAVVAAPILNPRLLLHTHIAGAGEEKDVSRQEVERVDKANVREPMKEMEDRDEYIGVTIAKRLTIEEKEKEEFKVVTRIGGGGVGGGGGTGGGKGGGSSRGVGSGKGGGGGGEGGSGIGEGGDGPPSPPTTPTGGSGIGGGGGDGPPSPPIPPSPPTTPTNSGGGGSGIGGGGGDGPPSPPTTPTNSGGGGSGTTPTNFGGNGSNSSQTHIRAWWPSLPFSIGSTFLLMLL